MSMRERFRDRAGRLWPVGRLRGFGGLGLAVGLALLAGTADAGSFADRLAARRAQRIEAQRAQGLDPLTDEATGDTEPVPLPDGVRVLRDVSYGADPRQRLDVYLPPPSIPVSHVPHIAASAAPALSSAPTIVMVHGGAWMVGDKAAGAVIENKVARWVTRGAVLVSVNYRLLPQADPLEQARDVARALAHVQALALDGSLPRQRLVLMGHSAGAHLVALLAASESLVVGQGASPWLATVLLDSAALDVPRIMEAPHARFYDRAFGRDPAAWPAFSPYHQLKRGGAPVLAVCSTGRADSCRQAQGFVAGAVARGTRAEVYEVSLSHRDINAQLGSEPALTRRVESFMAAADPALRMWLQDASTWTSPAR